MPEVSEADQHYLQRVVEDCEQLLGAGDRVARAGTRPQGRRRAASRYRLGPAEWTSEGHGETVIAAHAALREQLVLDRIRLGVRALVRQPR